MTQPSNPEHSGKKRTIEFDMFVRDLEPAEEEKIRGGSETGKPDKRAEEDRSKRRGSE